MKSSPLGCRSVVHWLVSLLMTLSLVCAAHAQQPVTDRSAVSALDKMKQTYEVKNFRIGGKYDLANSKAWENGGEGGTTLESLGAGPANFLFDLAELLVRDRRAVAEVEPQPVLIDFRALLHGPFAEVLP